MTFEPNQIIYTFIFGIVCGVGTSYLAKKKGRDSFMWFFAGFFFGIFGVLAVALLPAKENKEQQVIEVKTPSIHEGKEWYYLTEDQKQIGPVRYAVLRDLWEKGNLPSSTFVWTEGMAEWKTIEESGLFTS